MLGYALRLDDHVIDVHLNISSNLLFEDPIYQSLEYGPVFFRPKSMTL